MRWHSKEFGRDTRIRFSNFNLLISLGKCYLQLSSFNTRRKVVTCFMCIHTCADENPRGKKSSLWFKSILLSFEHSVWCEFYKTIGQQWQRDKNTGPFGLSSSLDPYWISITCTCYYKVDICDLTILHSIITLRRGRI